MRTVFLSSTAKGLQLYRDAVYSAVEGLDAYHCVRMEDFGARDKEPDDFCRTKVAECDIFVLILGHEYGSCPQGSEMSYTEREYEAALAARLPLLVFLAPADFPVQAHLIEPDEIRARQQRFRNRVKQDRVIDVFHSTDHLAQLVVQAIHNCKEELTQYMPPEGSESPPGKTWLLFNFVTNTAGFDTGITISNVSADPIGAVHQSGCVRLHFYGSNAPAAIRSSPVFPGTVYTNLASYMSPNFQGYVVAECNFYPARGYAFISDVGARNLATGYLAEILKIEHSVQ